MAFNILVAVLLVATAAELFGNAAAATYVVGDSLGWTVPPSAATYTTWASQHVFVVGDVLVFNFPTGIHDVAKVTKGAYDSCSSNNAMTLATLGPASFTINSTGQDYYICTFGQHCALGQKLSINVTSSAPSATPTPAPIPSSPTITPSPAPSVPVLTPVPSPVLTPSPESMPSPTPSGGSVIPPSPFGGASPPGLAPGPSSSSTGDLTPPPPPGSDAMRANLVTPLVVFATIAIALVLLL